MFSQYDVPIWDTLPWVPGSIPDSESHVVCRLTYAPGYFYEWPMTMEGQILIKEPDRLSTSKAKHRRGKMLSCIPNEKTEDLLKYTIKRLHSTRGIAGWAIRRYMPEPFVMAKLAGFPKRNVLDDAK